MINFKKHLAAALLCFLPSLAAAEISLVPSGVGTYEIREKNLLVLMTVASYEEDMYKATIAIRDGENVVYKATGDEFYSAYQAPELRLVEVDPSNDTLELISNQWTGGAHCCSDIHVFTKTDKGWLDISLGQFDGGISSDMLQDFDGDGSVELKASDGRFLYEFASYAGSFTPPLIVSVRNGKYTNLTRDETMKNEVQTWLEQMGTIPDEGTSRNSWLASHTATLLLLGDADPFAQVDGAFDATSTWGMERCRTETSDGLCPSNEQYTVSFPDALRAFLHKTGYLSEGQ